MLFEGNVVQHEICELLLIICDYYSLIMIIVINSYNNCKMKTLSGFRSEF